MSKHAERQAEILAAEVDELRTINAELLAALKATIKYGREEWAWDIEIEADDLLDQADAAIAKAEAP